jgi:hypothetical protein
MVDPEHLGRQLADETVRQMKAQEITLSHAIRRLACRVAEGANEMLGQGQTHEETATWVQLVERAFASRLDECLVEAAEAINQR